MQFDLRTMAEHMGGVAWGVVIVLLIMSIYSIARHDRALLRPISQATKQSRKYAPEVARFLKQGKIKEAIDVSARPAASSTRTWPRSSVVGLQEWQYQQEIGRSRAATRDARGRRAPSARSSAPPP